MSKVTLRPLIPIGVVVIAVVGMGSSAQGRPSSSDSPLRGAVKSSDGKPMGGVAVSARADGKTFTTTVYTDRDGAYYFPPLTPPMEDGHYKVWAQAVGFEAGRSEATLSAGKAVEQNFTLKTLQNFSRQLSAVEWLASLPEDTPEDRRGKRLLGVNCAGCHSFATFLRDRFDARGWSILVDLMANLITDLGYVSADDRVSPYHHDYKEEIVTYLTRVRGPDSPPLKYKPLPRASGATTQIVVTEYDISPGHLPGYVAFDNGSDWSQGYPSHYESRAPHDAVVDQQGYVWFCDYGTPKRTLGKLDPRTGRVTDYATVDKKNVPVRPHDIVLDQAGNVWVNSYRDSEDMLVKFDPRTEKFQHFPVSKSYPGTTLEGMMSVDSKGNVWQALDGKALPVEVDPKSGVHYRGGGQTDPQRPGGAAKLNPKTGEYTFYKAVTPGNSVYGAIADAENNVWFSQPGLNRIGRVDVPTGEVSEVILPARDDGNVQYTTLDRKLALKFQASGGNDGPPWQKAPKRGAADKKGITVWFIEQLGNRLLKIDIRTRKVTEYLLPYPYSTPYGIAVDKNHMVWISTVATDRLFKFDPFTEQFTVYPQFSLGSASRFVDVDNGTDPPTVWVPNTAINKIARVQFRTDAAYRAAER